MPLSSWHTAYEALSSCEMSAPIPGLSGVVPRRPQHESAPLVKSHRKQEVRCIFPRTSDKKTGELGMKIACGRVEVEEEEVCVGSVGLKLVKAARL